MKDVTISAEVVTGCARSQSNAAVDGDIVPRGLEGKVNVARADAGLRSILELTRHKAHGFLVLTSTAGRRARQVFFRQKALLHVEQQTNTGVTFAAFANLSKSTHNPLTCPF